MIERLTPEQEELLPVVRDRWIEIGLSTEPADRAVAEEGVRQSYEAAGLTPPKAFVWVDSPMAGCLGASLMAQWPEIGEDVWARLLVSTRTMAQDTAMRMEAARIVDNVVDAMFRTVDAVSDEIPRAARDALREAADAVREEALGSVSRDALRHGIFDVDIPVDGGAGEFATQERAALGQALRNALREVGKKLKQHQGQTTGKVDKAVWNTIDKTLPTEEAVEDVTERVLDTVVGEIGQQLDAAPKAAGRNIGVPKGDHLMDAAMDAVASGVGIAAQNTMNSVVNEPNDAHHVQGHIGTAVDEQLNAARNEAVSAAIGSLKDAAVTPIKATLDGADMGAVDEIGSLVIDQVGSAVYEPVVAASASAGMAQAPSAVWDPISGVIDNALRTLGDEMTEIIARDLGDTLRSAAVTVLHDEASTGFMMHPNTAYPDDAGRAAHLILTALEEALEKQFAYMEDGDSPHGLDQYEQIDKAVAVDVSQGLDNEISAAVDHWGSLRQGVTGLIADELAERTEDAGKPAGQIGGEIGEVEEAPFRDVRDTERAALLRLVEYVLWMVVLSKLETGAFASSDGQGRGLRNAVEGQLNDLGSELGHAASQSKNQAISAVESWRARSATVTEVADLVDPVSRAVVRQLTEQLTDFQWNRLGEAQKLRRGETDEDVAAKAMNGAHPIQGEVWAVSGEITRAVRESLARLLDAVAPDLAAQAPGAAAAHDVDVAVNEEAAQLFPQLRQAIGAAFTELVRGLRRDSATPLQAGTDPHALLKVGVESGAYGHQTRGPLPMITQEIAEKIVTGARDQIYKGSWGQHDTWLSVYDFFGRIGLDCVKPLEGLMKVAGAAGWWWPFTGVALMSDRPERLHRDQQGRLHCADGPAIRYRDGWGFYVWHGTRVPAWVVERPTVEDIAAEENTEIRRCGIESMGWDQFTEAAQLTPVDRCADPGNPGCELALYDVPEELWGDPVRVLLCVNGTTETDGIRRRFGLTVPQDTATAMGAAAWGYGLTEEQYAGMQRRC